MQYRYPSWLTALAVGLAVLGSAAQSAGEAAKHPQSVDADPAAWADYRADSDRWRAIEDQFQAAELAALELEEPRRPSATGRFGFDLQDPELWNNTAEVVRIADVIISFQAPSGGWSKRTDMGGAPRQMGQAFGSEPKYVSTFDNQATTVQMQVLAQAHSISGAQRFADAFVRGLKLILRAQYPNGGWPQIYPLAGGYHDHITYNDQVVENNLRMLHWVAQGDSDFVPEPLRRSAQASLELGLESVLHTQVITNGRRTLWGGQHNRYSLQPDWARAYEMPALATAESASLVYFLMELEAPSAPLVEAIHGAMAWFDQHRITGKRWTGGDTQLRPDPDAGPLWPRFAEIGSHRPVFGDRDGSINYRVGEVSEERRRSYGWYTDEPRRALEKYADWRTRFPPEHE